ncbi:hypothetical protein J4423_05450 [Candidatus Pacearchaeota archaeon]|nr:hypothetical protein [Candidatus Pacearchaeota archaeon]
MTKLQKFVVVLLIFIFNLVIYKMSSDNAKVLKQVSSNSGNIGFFVEASNVSGGSGG